MKYFFPLCLMLIAPAFSTSQEEKECEVIVSQQKSFHLYECQPYKEALLADWCSVVSARNKPLRTYLFWADNNAAEFWLRPFLDLLKQDMGALGVVLDDRMANKKSKSEDFKDSASVMAAEKVLLLLTNDLSLTVDGHNYRNCHAEWEVLANRLRAITHHIPEDKLIFNSGSIFPLKIAGYATGLAQLSTNSEGAILKTEEMKSFTYLKLLIRLVQFSYDLPADFDFYSESLAFIAKAKPELQ